jgi:hypothetical protein
MQMQGHGSVLAGGSGFLPVDASEIVGVKPGVTLCAVHEGDRAAEYWRLGYVVEFSVCENCHRVALAAIGCEVVADLDGFKHVVPVNREAMEVAA